MLYATLLAVGTSTGCQNGPQTSSAPLYGQSTIPPPGTANTALSNPNAYAARAPMGNLTPPGWGAPPNNMGAPPSNWNSTSIFGGSPAQPNSTAWNGGQPAAGYGGQGSIFDQAPPPQNNSFFGSFAGASPTGYSGGGFNPTSSSRGYESPNSSFVSATPAHSANRPAPMNSGNGGSWWDRLTGTQSTIPASSNPWNQTAPTSAMTNAPAWNDPRNPSFNRQAIPNPNATANNGWNINTPPNPYQSNPLNNAPNYTNYGSTAPGYNANNIPRTLPASTNPLRPTNTLPAGWSNGGAGGLPAATTPAATGQPWIKSLEDLPAAR